MILWLELIFLLLAFQMLCFKNWIYPLRWDLLRTKGIWGGGSNRVVSTRKTLVQNYTSPLFVLNDLASLFT